MVTVPPLGINIDELESGSLMGIGAFSNVLFFLTKRPLATLVVRVYGYLRPDFAFRSRPKHTIRQL